jgi:GNAT superfamily N-acetyltransferase
MSHSRDGLAIRAAGPADAPRLAALLTQLGYPVSEDEVSHRLTYWLGDSLSLVIVADRAGEVAGCLSVHAIPYLERTGRWARIESLVVEESARGAGLGRALVAAAENAASRWGCLAVEVTSSRTRAEAHAFYERMGYRDICGRSARFLKTLG